MAKQRFPEICLVSRAHRGDLYADARPFNYFPYRAQTLKFLDRLFVISDHGQAYVARFYPDIAPLCEVSQLGVRDSHAINVGSNDGVFRIVSCSSLTPVKRVPLLVRGISQAALDHPEKHFEWNHFGEGPMMAEIKSLAARILPRNVTWCLHGNLPNEEVLLFYHEKPIDVFVNVSSSEGLPVSIMEAACFGIPIIATMVGGIPEIVSERNGKLLNPTPSPSEISRAIAGLLDHPELRIRAGACSRQAWEEGYDADQNYSEFVNRLRLARNNSRQFSVLAGYETAR